MSAPDWRIGPADPIERCLEARGYWRERARQTNDPEEIERCRSQFEFAEGLLAKARADEQGSTRLVALDAVSSAIAARRLSSVGDLSARSDEALGVLGDSRLIARIDTELREPLLALLGNLPALFKSLLFNDAGGLSAALRQSDAAVAGVRAALHSVAGAGAAVRQKRRHIAKSREGGQVTAADRAASWRVLEGRILAEYRKNPGLPNKTIALELGCNPSQVTKALQAHGLGRRGKYSPRGAR